MSEINLLAKLTPILGVPVPPFLAKALGYTGDGRYLVFLWHKNNDSLFFKDGVFGLIGGNTAAYSLYVNHPKVNDYIKEYKLGNTEEIADDALVLDIKMNRLYVGDRDSAVDGFIDDLRETGGLPSNPNESERTLSIICAGLSTKEIIPTDITEMDTTTVSMAELAYNFESIPEFFRKKKEGQRIKQNHEQYCEELSAWLEEHPCQRTVGR